MGALSVGGPQRINEHEKAARYADLHEQRLFLLGEIDAAQCELMRVESEMTEIFGEMGTVGKMKAFQLLEAK